MNNWIVTGMCISLFACGGDDGKNVDDDKNVDIRPFFFDLTSAVTSVLETDQGLYYIFKDELYMVQNQDFENPYCMSNGTLVTMGVKGLRLTGLDNGILASYKGELADGPIKLEDNLPDFVVSRFLLSQNPAAIIAADYDGGAMMSTDGANWTQLISQDDESVRRILDIEFMGSIHQAVAINYEGGLNYSAVMLSDGEWHQISPETEINKFVYVNGKVLGLDNQSISVLDAVDGKTLNTIELTDTIIQYVAVLDDSLIFTDGKTGNYKFDTNTEQVSEFILPEDIGFITGIYQSKNNTLFGTSSGIWLKNESKLSQIFDSSSIYATEIHCNYSVVVS